MLSGAVDAAAPVKVPPVAVPLVDVPGPEPQEGERVREGQRVGEGQDAQDGESRRDSDSGQEGPLQGQRQRLPAAAGDPGLDRHGRCGNVLWLFSQEDTRKRARKGSNSMGHTGPWISPIDPSRFQQPVRSSYFS